MAKTMTTEERELGKAVLARLDRQRPLPTALKPFIRAFQQQHRGLEAAAARVDAARRARDEAIAAVAKADAVLDQQVDVLANRLIGADLGPRKNAFAPFHEIPPARLKELGYALEIERVKKLVAAIEAVKPPDTVRRTLATCASAAAASEKALVAFGPRQAAYSAVIGARDALLPDWTRALERLRLHAKAAWVDEPSTYRAIFARPGIESPHRRRRRAKPAPTPSPPAPPAPGAPPTSSGGAPSPS